MAEQPPLHRLFHHYSELPYSLRVLYTATLITLGLGYLFALLNIYFTYAGRAGGNSWMLTQQDLVVAYAGSGTVSRPSVARCRRCCPLTRRAPSSFGSSQAPTERDMTKTSRPFSIIAA